MYILVKYLIPLIVFSLGIYFVKKCLDATKKYKKLLSDDED